MSKPSLAVAVVLLVAATAIAGTVALTNEAPLADAGLDQEVTKGATVHLDGTGSHDPDGAVETYDWTIRTPSNATVSPDCETCARTSFEPTETGRYRVTLAVTDDDGATSTDTLYVDVAPGAAPDVSISGPEAPTEGDSETYTATFEPGAAALEYVAWTVDGVEIANHSLSADQETDTAAKRFPTPGSRTITATVYDVDGQTSTSSLGVAVQSEPDSPSQSPSRSPGTDPSGSVADRASPVVDGDALVTGDEPLRGQYEVQLDAAGDVESVEWRTTAGRAGTGRTLTRTWEPGDHDLYAIVAYVDGSENVATFADGSTEVVADSSPNVSLESLDRFGSISGHAVGVDEYENLKTLRVEVDGETVATAQPTLREYRQGDAGWRQMVSFSVGDFTPGERHVVTIVAIDERGQVSETSREIVPVKKPEIVRSEFVNDPVDSYHERINASRYTAHHVLEIDLNGVDPENVSIEMHGNNSNIRQLDDEMYTTSEEYSEPSGILEINTFWGGDYPKYYQVRSNYRVPVSTSTWNGEEEAVFKVTPSEPELRLDVVNDGTEDYITREHGILVDASDSFDPDKTSLKYLWKYGATPTKPDNTTAKFGAYERAASIVEDEYDLREKRNFDFLEYFVPDIESREVVNDGPHYTNDTVRVRVETEPYHFSKETYYDDFALGLSTSTSKAEVVEWHVVEAPDSPHSDATEDAYRYAGIIEIPASELASDSSNPVITVYNEENDRKTSEVEFPEAKVWTEDGRYWDGITIEHLSYQIENPEIDEVTVDSEDQRDQYLHQGYSLDEERQETEYVLEERVKVQDAEYETESRNFDSKQLREMFIASQDGWYPTGSYQKEVTGTRIETEWRDSVRSKWRDSNRWNGEFTGATREVLVEPAQYRIDRKYEYDYQVEKTGTRTVTRTNTVSIPRTGTRTVTHCTLKFGCYETTETYTYTETVTYTYTTTETYTYTVTRTNTYWAPSKMSPSHRATGEERRVKMQDAVYETQYEIEQKTRYTDTVTIYEASQDVLVQPERYEWQPAQSTEDGMLAQRKANLYDDWRIGESETRTLWILSKQTGTTQFEAQTYANESRVVETSAVVNGDIVQKYVHESTGEETTNRIEEQTEEFTYDGAKERSELLRELQQTSGKERWCKITLECT